MRTKITFLLIGYFVLAHGAYADLTRLLPVQDGWSYAVPFFGVLMFGSGGVLTLIVAFASPRSFRPYLLAGGTLIVLFQYVLISVDLSQYGDVFNWYDGIVLPAYVLMQPEVWDLDGPLLGLAIPSLLVILTTLTIPAAWYLHLRLNKQMRQAELGAELAERVLAGK